MKTRPLAVLMTALFLSIAVALLLSCGGGGGGSTPPPPPPTSTVLVTACTGTPAATVVAVGTSNWSPGSAAITVNDVVKWTNSTGTAHTVTSTTVPAGGTFNESLPDGAAVCLKFTATGTYNYHCALHPVMLGSVTVN